MDQKVTWGIIVAIIAVLLIGGGWWLLQQNNTTIPAINSTTQTPSGQTGTINNPDQTNAGGVEINAGVDTGAAKTWEVTYTDAGFSPSALTIKKGDTVAFNNQSSGGMWVGSASHPTHTAYSGTSAQQHCPDPENDDFDQCQAGQPGTSWSFTFAKTGSWAYHNHMNATKFGKIIVQ